MNYLSRTLASGAVLLAAGTITQASLAQDYVDVEGERATASSSDAYDPYRVKPAQAYPTTSYGVSSGSDAATTTAASGANQNLGNLLNQLQQLQQEVMMLNGKVEEQSHELSRLTQQYQEQYVDMDRRIVALGGANASMPLPTAGNAAAAASEGATAVAVVPTPAPRSGSKAAAEQPGEGEAYRAAYGLVRGQQWDAAIKGFNRFLQSYPEGRYAPNAYYWLGELYLVTEPQQLESARQAFMMLLTQYPDNNKVPDALYKLGKVQFQKGNPAKGREYLDRVVNEYGNTNSSAVRLARDFIEENY